MKKILLIEDRFKRQEMFREALGIELEKYNEILDNIIFDKYEEHYQLLKKQEFDFTRYSIIIVHKSAFGNDNSVITAYIERMCKEQSIILIYFSGGIDANYYQREADFKLFEVNSKTLYSSNLTLFLDTFKDGILKPAMLLYGRHWDINVLCNISQKLNIYIEKLQDNNQLEDFFYEDNPNIKQILYQLKNNIFYKPKSVNGEISKEEMKKLLLSIQIYIEERLSYE
jgi:hypothetical protein